MIIVVFAGLLIAQYITTICLAILALFYFFYGFSKRSGSQKKIFLYICFFVSVIAVALALSLPLRYRIVNSFQLVSGYGRTTSLASRLFFLSNFMHLISNAPLQGIGLGSKVMLSGMFSADWRILYISLMLGIPVALCLFFIYVYIFSQARKKLKSLPFMSDEWKILQITCITFSAIIISDFSNGHIISAGPSNYIAWFLAGAAFSNWHKRYHPCLSMNPEPQPPPTKQETANRGT
jgi:hypothetical protein